MTGRKTHWENVYSSKSPLDVSWYQQEPTLSLKLIGNTGLNLDSQIIDVGGGASKLVDALCRAGYLRIGVLDVSAQALVHTRERLGEAATQVEWYEADVTEFKPPHRFDLWHDRAVFHFLTDPADRDSYVKTLKQTLQPGGHVIMMTFAVNGPEKCSGLDIVQYDDEKLLSALGNDFELAENGHEPHVTPSGGKQDFAWFRLAYKPV